MITAPAPAVQVQKQAIRPGRDKLASLFPAPGPFP